MRDVVIVGGGLTGLVAAYELSKSDLAVTLVEVKRHPGGSLRTIQAEGAIMDAGTFAIQDTLDAAWLSELGLDDALFELGDGAVAFKQGTGQLVSALMERISATRLMRMAVSSIGELENGKFSVCMENGLMFDAGALILAVPARYAARMFYGYINPISEALLDYHYDTIQRVSLVCPTDETPDEIDNPPDMAYSFIHRTTHPERVPDGYTLLQFGLRIDPERVSSGEDLVQFVRDSFDLPQALTWHAGYWPEADPVSCYDDEHPQRITEIRAQLPQGIALIGNDYSLVPPAQRGVARFDERIEQGITAAQAITKTVK